MSIDDLMPYMEPYWRDYVEGAALSLSPTQGDAYPPGAPTSATPEARSHGSFPPRNVGELTAQVLDRWGLSFAVLNCTASFDTSRNPYFEAALTRAINDWLRAEWLDHDDRLRASMLVPTLDPEAAIEEIERLGGDNRFVQVLLPVRTDLPYGNKHYHALYDKAAEYDLVIGIHAWGRIGNAPTSSGFTHSYLEDYLSNSQLFAQAQVVSLVAEGVFARVPSLRVALLECGFSWLPSLLWRLDKDWKAVWREVPWVKSAPSEYVHRHIRATTAPAHLPLEIQQVREIADMVKAHDFLMYASDYPHNHGPGLDRLLEAVSDDTRRAMLHDNAATFYRQMSETK